MFQLNSKNTQSRFFQNKFLPHEHMIGFPILHGVSILCITCIIDVCADAMRVKGAEV